MVQDVKERIASRNVYKKKHTHTHTFGCGFKELSAYTSFTEMIIFVKYYSGVAYADALGQSSVRSSLSNTTTAR